MSASEVTAEATVVHVNLRDTQSMLEEGVIASLELNKVDYAVERNKSLRARYYFGIIFLIMNLVAWFFRDYGQSVLLPFIHFKTRKLCEHQNLWHSGWWEVKSVLLLVSMALPFFFPSELVQIYGEIARIGAGIFLLLQLVSVIHFITWWNKYWTPDEERKQRCSLGLFLSTMFYVASISGIVYLYTSYASRTSCSLNIFFITWTVILLAAMMVISLNSKVNRGLLSSGIMASYVVFLCWNAIRSEPATIRCETKNQEKGNSSWITILGFLIAIFAIVMAAFSTGIDSKCFQLWIFSYGILPGGNVLCNVVHQLGSE
uniref:Serine incorporator 3 n=1 Tax=Glycine max TaxID=3847 RepID=A0A0R0E8F9_SOYBN